MGRSTANGMGQVAKWLGCRIHSPRLAAAAGSTAGQTQGPESDDVCEVGAQFIQVKTTIPVTVWYPEPAGD